ncbi:MAG TPA: ATP-binding cassette domain-containing protein [Pseudonocardia sp.]|jgi:phospholipid/cholesterol/gamma-HCH transport system ATP-binding protein
MEAGMEPTRPRTELLAPEVEMDNITTILDDTAVMHRLALRLPAGKITVLMGPSGVGKTTLIKHLVGLLEPSGGTVRFDGRDIWESTPAQWQDVRKGIGAMLGGSNLFTTSVFSSISVVENLIYTLEAIGVPEDERYDIAMRQLRELNLDEMADQMPESLPAHAWKRVALARALVTDAPLIVLDEIDVGLDQKHSEAMVNAVRKMHDRTGCTLLITTHTLELAREMADRLAIMVNGRIVAVGSPMELLDGVKSSDDFDQRYEFSDQSGPPRLEEAQADADRRPLEPRQAARGGRDRTMVTIAVIAIVLVIALFVLLKLLPG